MEYDLMQKKKFFTLPGWNIKYTPTYPNIAKLGPEQIAKYYLKWITT